MNNYNKRKTSDDEEVFDIQKLIARLLDHWLLFAVSLVVCLVLSVAFIWYATPQYNVHAQVLVKDDQNSSSSAFSFIGGSQMQQLGSLFGIKSNVSDELGVLETRDLLEQVTKDLNLNITYYNKGVVKSVEMYESRPFKVIFTPLNDSTPASTVDISFNSDYNSFLLTSNNIDINQPKAKIGDTIITSIGTLVFLKNWSAFSGK